LIYGFGNPGRQDDGLGVAFAERLEQWAESENIRNIEFDTNYQLNIEDAEVLSNHDLVIFADASVEETDSFYISRITGNADATFTTHAASPEYIVYLCESLFHRKPAAFLLHIKGYEWEMKEGLTGKAGKNLVRALDRCKDVLRSEDVLTELNKLTSTENV